LSSNTIRLARAPLNAAFRFAVENGFVSRNPVSEAKPPVKRKSVPAHWTPEQAREFLAWHEGDRLYPLWAFMLSTGVRIGELVSLTWGDVDREARRVHIRRFSSALGDEVVECSGKSVDAIRSIDIDDHLVAILDQQRQLQFDELGALALVVFNRPDGEPFHPQGISKQLGRTSSEIGLPRLTAHGLRHTCATLMLASGVPPKVAAERLGHSDPTLFTNLYSHVTPTMQRDAAQRIGGALFEDGGGWPQRRQASPGHEYQIGQSSEGPSSQAESL
jgi:integrase